MPDRQATGVLIDLAHAIWPYGNHESPVRMTSQRRVRKFHELLKRVSHSAKCTCSASCLSLCVTKKRCLHMHDDALSTTVHGVHHDPVAPLPPSRRCVLRVATTLCFTFLYPSLAGPLFYRVFPCPHHLSQGRHSMFLRPGHNLRSSLYPKRQRR